MTAESQIQSDLFIGREGDMEFLQSLYDSGKQVSCSIMGRRRIGKTTLLEEFCKDKKNLFFRFRRKSMPNNLIHISRVISAATGEPPKEYPSLEDALDDIRELCSKTRYVVVFDEYPFIAEIDESVSSDFQHFVDGLRRTKIMVVFCGSSISGMRNEFENGSSPLYGRITAKRTIRSLSYRECIGFHPEMDDLDMVRLYLTIGGVPLYHMMMREDTYRECVARHFLGNGADLSDEAENIVSCELSPKEKYISVVEAVADGCTELKDISKRADIPKSTCSGYLDNLEALEIVDRINPMMMRSGAESPFTIADSMVAFNYEVLERYPELRTYGDSLGSYDALYPEIATFFGRRFERMCANYIRNSYITLEIGKWWGRVKGEDTDIDIVADVSDGRNKCRLYCECKFRRKETTFKDYMELKSVVDELNKNNKFVNERFVMFSASGFSDSLMEAAEDDPRLILVDLDMIIGRKNPTPLTRETHPTTDESS